MFSFIALCLLGLLLPISSGTRCHQEMVIPKSFDSFPDFQQTKELHFHGHHQVDLNATANITFTISEESFFRAYMSPHKVDIDLYLYRDGVRQDSSFSAYREELISAVLTPALYTLEIRPLLYANTLSTISLEDCQTIYLEVAISPTTRTKERLAIASAKCPTDGVQILPELQFTNQQNSYLYDSTLDLNLGDKYNVNIPPSQNQWRSAATIKNYTFTLVQTPGSNPTFNFQAILGYDFLTGGDLRLLLVASDRVTDISTCEWWLDNCMYGVNLAPSTHTLQTTLGPGNYSLWIISKDNRRFNTTCTPFTLRVSIEPKKTTENFLSCAVERIPETLNEPGFIDDNGYLYYRERVFVDLSKRTHETSFTLNAPSLFRVWVEAHRVDIDLTLKDETGNVLALTNQVAGKAESIIYELQPRVKYTIQYKYYTSLNAFFCEAFLLEIGITPLTPDYNVPYCAGKTQDIPSFAAINSRTTYFKIRKQPFAYFFKNSSNIRFRSAEIASFSINASTDLKLTYHLAAPFYVGMTGTLERVLRSNRTFFGDKTVVETFPITEYNAQRFSAILSRGGEYKFTLSTGPFQSYLFSSTPSSFPQSPPCAFFEFEFSIERVNPLADVTCPYSDRVPTDLSGPQYLGTSNRVHFQDRFLIPPKPSGFDTSESIRFSIQTPSLLRAYTDTKISGAIDFSISDGSGRPVAGAAARTVETERANEASLLVLLQEGSYIFTINYFNIPFDDVNGSRCQSWNLEFEIAPAPADSVQTSCDQDKKPTSINSWGYTMVQSRSSYSFSQNSTSFSARVPIYIGSNFAFFRALVFYDYVWSDLTLRLYKDQDNLLVTGDNHYNKNEIDGLQLAPGQYILEINETLAQPNANLRKCIDYILEVGISPISSGNDFALNRGSYVGCEYTKFPTKLNIVSYLSDLTGNMFHLGSEFYLEVTTIVSTFTITTDSYFRLFVPPHAVDIDIYLNKLEGISGFRDPIGSGTGLVEEQILAKLVPGDYEIRISFISRFDKDRFVPLDPNACLSFFLELSIAPVTYVDTYYITPAPTPPSPFVNDQTETLQFDRSVDLSLYRPSSSFTHSFNFYLPLPSLFRADVLYPFVTGSIYFTLKGVNIDSPFLSSPPNRTWSGYIGQGISFFDLVLYPGEYTLVLQDKTNLTRVRNSPTDFYMKYNLRYFLELGTTPENYCDEADTLPTDLFTTAGGSKSFGGPQRSDGAVTISGNNFLIPASGSHNYIYFKIYKPSHVRFWAAAAAQGDNTDIDFLLWKNDSKTVLLDSAVGVDAAESQMAFLDAQTEPYVLDVYIFQRSKKGCSYLTFELSIETNESAFSRLQCPSPLPNPQLPPASISVDRNFAGVYSTDFVFTKEYIERNQKVMYSYNKTVYDITLSVQEDSRDKNGEYWLYAMLGFDFVLSDISVALLRNGTSIGDLGGTPPYTPNSYVTFQTWVTANVRPGTYILRIVHKSYKHHVLKAGQCDRFSFTFLSLFFPGKTEPTITNGTSSPVPPPPPMTPHVISVIPPTGNQLDASLLSITIKFSDRLDPSIPTAYRDLRAWLKNNSAVYLIDNGSEEERNSNTNINQAERRVYPNYGRIQFSTDLYVGFKLLFGHAYTLVLNAPTFYALNHTSFAPYLQQHNYAMLSCTCGGRGSCTQNASRATECVCQFPYAGPECKTCQQGYYRRADQCMPAQFCTAGICSGHGTCDDSKGYPVCHCDEGFANSGEMQCNVCNVGYQDNYPNCTRKEDTRKTRCTAPLLPADLNTVGYLHYPPSRDYLHLQGDYFIDLDHVDHELQFTLTKPSYFRVYTEPHTIDIDLWLWKFSPDKKDLWRGRELIANGISYNDEETFFLHLDNSTYFLSVSFIPTATVEEVGDCPTFNFEIEILSDDYFKAEVDRIRPDCGAQNQFPDLKLSDQKLPKTGKFVYAPKDKFSVVALDTKQDSSRSFHNISFSVEAVPNKVLFLSIEIEFRFITGHVAVKLFQHENVPNSTLKKTTVVATGFNGLNKHLIRHNLAAGDYTIQLYLPVDLDKSVTPCAPFTFSLEASYVDEEQDIFNCNFPHLPPSLEIPPFSGRKRHIYESFLIDVDNYVTEFTISEPSYFRISADPKVASPGFMVILERKISGTPIGLMWETIGLSEGGEIAASLQNGNYRLQLQFNAFFDVAALAFINTGSDQFCNSVDVELVIEPKSLLSQSIGNVQCPPGSISKLPQIPQRFNTLPYYFPASLNPALNWTNFVEEIFYGHHAFGADIFSVDFEIYENAVLRVGLSSHFLTANLGISLVKKNSTFATKGVSMQEDYNYITSQLSTGKYTLMVKEQVELPWDASSSSPRLACIPFTFSFTLTPVSLEKADPCAKSALREIPTTLNLLRYLSPLENSLTLESKDWAVPRLDGGFARRLMNFTIFTESIVRLFVAENAVDIDIFLHNNTFSSSFGRSLISGSSGFGDESFVIIVPPGNYYVRFNFYLWGTTQPTTCARFDMQLSITPYVSLSHTTLCPSSNVETLPSIPATLPTLPYKSLQSPSLDGDYHYQQTDRSGAGNAYPIFSTTFALSDSDRKSPVNIFVEVAYNFVISDLLIKAEAMIGGTKKTYVGQNDFHRNVLVVKNLPPDVNYTLTLFEATPNSDKRLVSCSHFMFTLVVAHARPSVQRSMTSSSLQILPSSLDSVAYLKYSDVLHLSDVFYLLNPQTDSSASINLTLRQESLVRIGVPIESPLSVDTKLAFPHAFPSKLVRLPPGFHTLYLLSTVMASTSELTSHVEIQAEPVSRVENFLNSMKCLAKNTQQKWQPPTIIPRASDDSYLFRDKDAYLISSQINAQDKILYVLPFTVKLDSVVSVQLQFDFLLTPLQVAIDSDGPIYEATRYGTSRYNFVDLNVQVHAGTYKLTILSSRPLSSESNSLKELFGENHAEIRCVDFDFAVSISVLGTNDDRVDCSSYALFPYDLNSPTGGSDKFGGPMKYGKIAMWHDKFLLSDNTQTMRTTFSLEKQSMISVFVSQSTYTELKPDIFFANGTAASVVRNPVTSYGNYFQWAGVYKLSAGNYYIELQYQPSTYEQCSYFSCGVSIDPVGDVSDYLSSVCHEPQGALPPAQITGVYQNKGYFTLQNIRDKSNTSTHIFSYPMDFSVSQESYLDVSLSFNALSSLFTLNLYRLSSSFSSIDPSTTYWEKLFDGQYDATSEGRGYLGLTQQISFKPMTGQYRLTIEHLLTDNNLLPIYYGDIDDPSSSSPLCFPYLLEVQITDTSGGSIVRSVEPRGGDGFDPQRDINIEIRFSTPLFTSQKELISRASNTAILSQAIILRPASSARDITASQVTLPIGNPYPDDFTRWLFVYKADQLKFGETYNLILSPENPVYGPDGALIKMPQTHTYQMRNFDFTCAGQGTYDNTTMKCTCFPQSHRTGQQCESCMKGYVFDRAGSNRKCIPEPTCLPDSCGCLPGTEAGKCEPKGDCSVIPKRDGGSTIKCECRYPQYFGPRCDECSKGYTDYPLCTPLCPRCLHGNCSMVTGTCACNGNWAGPLCDRCGDGYAGSNCEDKSQSLTAVIVVMVLLVILVIVGAVLLWWFKFRKAPSPYVDETLELELEGGRRVAGGGSVIAGLTDEDEQIDDDLVADSHDIDDTNNKKGNEKESLISLDDDEYEPAKKGKNFLG